MLIVGPTEDDRAYAEALRRAAKRFGHIIGGKARADNDQRRRSAGAEMPLFTQAAEYDVVLVADERGDFASTCPTRPGLPPGCRHSGSDRHRLAQDRGDLWRRAAAEAFRGLMPTAG